MLHNKRVGYILIGLGVLPLLVAQATHILMPTDVTASEIPYSLQRAPKTTQGEYGFEIPTTQGQPKRRFSIISTSASPRTQTTQMDSAAESLLLTPLPHAANYWFTYMRPSQTFYIQYNLCESLEGLAFEDFVVDWVAAAQRQVVNKLVLDLRINPGGDGKLNTLLFAGIYGYMAKNPNVSLFVLIGPQTLGAAQQLAVQLQRYTPAMLVSTSEAPPIIFPANVSDIHPPYSEMGLWYIETLHPPGDMLKPDLILAPKVMSDSNEQDSVLAALVARPSTAARSFNTPQPYTGTLAALNGTPRTARWHQDLEVLTQKIAELSKIHGGKFNIAGEDEFQQAVADLDAAIPVLEDHKITMGMMQLLTRLGDAHTRIPYWEWPAFEQTAYPIQVQWFSDGLFVTAVQPGYEVLLRTQIVQIGDIESERVLERLARFIPHENTYGLRAASTFYLVRPVILHALGLTPDIRSAQFVFQNSPGVSSTRYLPAMPAAEMQNTWLSALSHDQRPLYLQRTQDTYYWYTYLESTQTLYFQYNVCGEMTDMPFWDFADEMFLFMQTHATQRLVIDLRRNNGGRIESLSPILVNLTRHPQFSQQGRLFVLIGGQTFSSAVYLSALIQESTEAMFIGEPTAQGPNFYASFLGLKLPHSGLVVHYPMVYWQTTEQESPLIAPDVWVSLSSADYFAGKDPVLMSALFASE